MRAAQESGLDFVFLTDLNLLNPDLSIEGYHRQTMAFIANSFSYLDSHLLLYEMGAHRSIDSVGQEQLLLADLLSRSVSETRQDLLILAHPFKVGYTWSGPYPEGLDGIEVINLKSVWQHAWLTRKVSFLWSILVYPFNADLAFLRLYSEPVDEISLWDQLLARRRTTGFAGTEATAKTASIGSFYLRFPSYQTTFNLISNHVLLRSELTGDFDNDKRKIMTALARGQFYMALDVLGSTKGFTYYAQDGDRVEPIGSTVKWHKGLKLEIRLGRKPKVPFEMYLLRDGQRVLSENSTSGEYSVSGPGVYRVVVRVIPTLPLPDGRRWIPWIYTNPIYVK